MEQGAGKRLASKLLEYYERVQSAHVEFTGRRLQEYKPTEPERLAEVFAEILKSKMAGREFLAEVLHRLIWSQCLGNGNHRTSTLFLQAFAAYAGIRFPYDADAPGGEKRFLEQLTRYTDRSKRLLDRQGEWGYGPHEMEKRHAGLTLQWVEEMSGPQSLDRTTIGAQRLMTFSS